MVGMQANINKELAEASDGALRVSRRKVLYALDKMMGVYERLELEERGNLKRETSIANIQQNIVTDLDVMASNIESELTRRGAEYQSREEVMD